MQRQYELLKAKTEAMLDEIARKKDFIPTEEFFLLRKLVAPKRLSILWGTWIFLQGCALKLRRRLAHRMINSLAPKHQKIKA